MNALMQAQQAYGATKSATQTGRETEAQLLQGSIAELSKAAAGLPGSFPRLANALHRNRQIWTHLAVSVADQDNALPSDLKARIFYLSEFVASHSAKVLRSKADVAPLIEVNSAIVRGLNVGGAQ